MATHERTALERAFEIARSGQCRTTADIQKRLKQEGYATNTVIGPTLMKQLRALIDETHLGTRKDT